MVFQVIFLKAYLITAADNIGEIFPMYKCNITRNDHQEWILHTNNNKNKTLLPHSLKIDIEYLAVILGRRRYISISYF